jgi:hypothetical protein
VSHLADIQCQIRDALVTGKIEGIARTLIGGHDGTKRLAIHQRHYESSLVQALVAKFPATAWLAGTSFIADAARRFVREQPPNAPCIAEYGERFPEFLSEIQVTNRLPYFRAFAELEWHIGHAPIAVDEPAVTIEDFSRVDPAALLEMSLTLQGGLRYLAALWPIDELMQLYLTEKAPELFEFNPHDVWLEICGSRGQFRIDRLEAAEFVFRKAIARGLPIGAAAESTFDLDPVFDPGRALVSLAAAGLVTGLIYPAGNQKKTTNDVNRTYHS